MPETKAWREAWVPTSQGQMAGVALDHGDTSSGVHPQDFGRDLSDDGFRTLADLHRAGDDRNLAEVVDLA